VTIPTTAQADLNDPENLAVAAILALDLDALIGHGNEAIAAALAPHVAAAPAPRERSGSHRVTAAEVAVRAARRFVEGVENPAGCDPSIVADDQLNCLRKMQSIHRKSAVLESLGSFPGYEIRVAGWGLTGVRIQIWSEALTDAKSPILTLEDGATCREVKIAIAAWETGRNSGFREGARHVRQGVRSLLELD
jgi:hypothetical protein